MYLDPRLWALTSGVRGRIAATVLVGLAAVAAGIARLALLGWLLGRVLAGESLASLTPAIALTALALAARSALDYARTMVAHHTAARVQERLRRTLYAQVAELGPAHFVRARTGDVMLSLVEGVQQLETYFGQYLPQLFVAAITPLLIFAFVAFLDLPVALVLLAAALAALLAPALWHSRDRSASLARNRAYAAFGADFLDAVQGLATLKAFGQSGARARQLEVRARELFRSTMWVLGSNTLARGITDTVIAVGAAAALALGAWRVSNGSMSVPALLVILMLGVEVFRPLRELRILLHQGMLGLSAARGIFALLDAKPAVSDRPAGPEPLDAGVAFEGITFAYPGARRPAHAELSFQVRPGERVAIVGPSGSGKSTIARLLLRFHDPDRGRVTIGGRDLRELSLEQIRSRVALVSQDTWLFHGTVEDNIRMGKPDASVDELQGGYPRGERGGVHPAPATRLRHRRRRARRAALGRPAPAHRDRSRAPARRAHPGARRGALVGRRGERGADPVGAGPSHARPHHARLRAPPLERRRRRPDPGARRGTPGGAGHARRADRSRRRLYAADGRAGEGRRRSGGGRGAAERRGVQWRMAR